MSHCCTPLRVVQQWRHLHVIFQHCYMKTYKAILYCPWGNSYIGPKMAKAQRTFLMRTITCAQLLSYPKLIFKVSLSYKLFWLKPSFNSKNAHLCFEGTVLGLNVKGTESTFMCKISSAQLLYYVKSNFEICLPYKFSWFKPSLRCKNAHLCLEGTRIYCSSLKHKCAFLQRKEDLN